MTNTPKDEEPPPIVRVNRRSAEAELEAKAETEATEEYELWDAADQTKKLPARFANRMFVSPEGQHLRISFGERIGDDNIYHTVLVIPSGEALEMAQLLERMAQANVGAQIAHLRGLADALDKISSSGDEQNG